MKFKRTNRSRRRRFTTPQLVILITIALTMVVVIIATVSSLVFTPERVVKNKISELASEYYETYLYPNFRLKDSGQEAINEAMKIYENRGLSAITLRQLLLYDHKKNSDDAPLLEKYCDKDSTIIKYYPEYPYSQTSYRTEYTYSCEF